ncbi:MAG TPA: NADH-quinone oxidoreductase subunit J [Opitutaceae bacterium]|nr:NADH-quinone oxidoreductase subunit J [Opitutaceae bacterium]
MSPALIIIALVTLAAAAVAMTLRNLIHSALLLIGSWAGVAAFYLWAGAQFVAFGQVLVYVGAVSMIVLFAVLLTRRSRADLAVAPDSLGRALGALLVGGAVLGVLFGAILSSPLDVARQPAPTVTVRALGHELMGPHAAALLVAAVILTVALLGAVVIAATDEEKNRPPGRSAPPNDVA